MVIDDISDNISGDVSANQDTPLQKSRKETMALTKSHEDPEKLRVLGNHSDSFINQSHTKIIYPSHHSNTSSPQSPSKACVMSEQSPPGLFAACCIHCLFPSASSGFPAPRLYFMNLLVNSPFASLCRKPSGLLPKFLVTVIEFLHCR